MKKQFLKILKSYKIDLKGFLVPADEVAVDNIVFRLHYQLTFMFLVTCAVLITSKEFINKPIDCIAEKSIEHVIETFCFLSSMTYTVAELRNSSFVRTGEAVYPGVGPYSGKGDIIRHTYYMWVPIVLFLQAVMFYIPKQLWKMGSNSRLECVVEALRVAKLIGKQERDIGDVNVDSLRTRSEKITWFCKMYLSMARFKVVRDWAWKLTFCEFLNLANVLLQVWITNRFFRGQFLNLGIDWWIGDQDALDGVFPKVTKCTFHKYGPSGSIQTHDTICIMSVNIINEKVYLMLWFWLIGLFIATGLALIWRLLTLLLHKNYTFTMLAWSEISPGFILNPKHVEILTGELCFADWLFLYYVGSNIDGYIFRVAVSLMAIEIMDLSRDERNFEEFDLLFNPGNSFKRDGELIKLDQQTESYF